MFAGRELRNMVDELLWVPLKISWRWLLQDLFCCVALLPCCKIFLLCCLVALVIVVAVFFFVIFASVVVVIIYPDRNPCCHCCRSCFNCCCHFVYPFTTGSKGGIPPLSYFEYLQVTLERQPGKHLGIRISGSCPEPGIFIVEILEDSITALDGRIKVTLDIMLAYCQCYCFRDCCCCQ